MQLRPNTSLNTKPNKMSAFRALKEIHGERIPVDTDDAAVPSGRSLREIYVFFKDKFE